MNTEKDFEVSYSIGDILEMVDCISPSQRVELIEKVAERFCIFCGYSLEKHCDCIEESK